MRSDDSKASELLVQVTAHRFELRFWFELPRNPCTFPIRFDFVYDFDIDGGSAGVRITLSIKTVRTHVLAYNII